MSNKEYSAREQNIIKKLNKVNTILENKKIKIQYSVYNYNGIASKLEKTDLYSTDVTNSVFLRTHKCKANCMIDKIVNSCNLQENVTIEECFNTKISDIENASVEELVAYFGDMDNHEYMGLGKNKNYKISYKGMNNCGQDIEILATYGNECDYKIRTSVTQINKDGTISKVYSDKKVTCNNNYETKQNIITQGIESRNPESYSVLEKNIGENGKKIFKINCLGNQKSNFSVIANDESFKDVDSISYGINDVNYYENKGKIEKATGKLACRIDAQNNSILKPNFIGATNISEASKITDEYYNKYKNYPIINFDSKASKFIVKGEASIISKLNLNEVLENAKENFDLGLKSDIKIVTKVEKNG